MRNAPKKIAILGSTGSIGRSTLDVVARHRDRLQVVGLAAGSGGARLTEQILRFRPAVVSVKDERAARDLAARLDGRARPRIGVGTAGATEVAVASGADLVVSAIVGAAGLLPTLAALSAGITVALANKESLVVAGELMVRAAREAGAQLLPVDSEHNAIHQCLRAGRREEVDRIILTGSGGPFRGMDRSALERVSVEEALRHPTWSMGPKITVDSATLMNKGLEVIEASFLFGIPAERIDVVIHPQSVVHSMVRFRDGSVVAQLGAADMRHPIQYALSWPERWESAVAPLDILEVGALTFEPPDHERFPCLGLAREALRRGGTAPARLNAANEVAVAAFLAGQIRFVDIPAVIEEVLAEEDGSPADSVEDLLAADREARRRARAVIGSERIRR